jgi:hypothetical protein
LRGRRQSEAALILRGPKADLNNASSLGQLYPQ